MTTDTLTAEEIVGNAVFACRFEDLAWDEERDRIIAALESHGYVIEGRDRLAAMRRALMLAKDVLAQGGSITTRIAANGPTIGGVIDRAMISPTPTKSGGEG